MTDANLGNLIIMGSDIGKFDKKGLESFRQSFSDTITPPDKIIKSAETAATRVLGVALISIVIVIAIIVIGMLGWSLFIGAISFGTALGLLFLIFIAFWMGYLFFSSMMKGELDEIGEELKSHVGQYSENFFEELLLAVGNGASAYVKAKENTKEIPEFTEEELDSPTD